VVKYLPNLASIEAEMCVAEVGETNDREKQDQVRVVQLTLVLEGVVSQLVAVRNVMDVRFVFPVVAACVAAEDVDVAVQLVIQATSLTEIMVCCSDARTRSHIRRYFRSWQEAR
jgi:hypothetical protein